MSLFTPLHTTLVAFALARLVAAVQIFSNNTIPADLTTGCMNALLADVACSPVVTSFRNGYYYPASTLNNTCTPACTTALSSYESKIGSACSNQTWDGYDDEDMPIVVIADLLRYQYSLTCLQDSGRWCNVLAASAALNADPGNSLFGWDSSPPNGTNVTDPCDMCFIKGLQLQAGSPYYDGPALASQSIYQSKTSSCKVTGYPLTSTLGFYTPPTVPSATPTSCSGISYTIKPSDDCYSISKSQGIGTAWLISDNSLTAYCVDFPASGNLCLVNTCSVYSVQTNDTCNSIAAASNITVAQLKAWNPIVNAGCYNIDKMNGTQLCISIPGTPYVKPTSISVLAPSTASTAALVPTDVATGTNTDCGEYYRAMAGDYCNLLTLKFGISLDDFVFLNPAINENCTNLYANESYCIEAVGDINTYPGRPGYTTPAPTITTPFTAFTNLPTATYTTPTSNVTAFPLANGTRDDCNKYFNGDVFQSNITGSNWNSQCELAAAVYGVDLNDFGLWNPDIGNVTLASCSFKTGVQYCGKLYFGSPPPPPQVPDTTLPVRDGSTPNCTQYGDVPDDWQCTDVLYNYDLTIAQFYSYNPEVNSDCTGLWTGYAYCIRAPGYVDLNASSTRTTASPTTSTASSPTAPTLSGQPSNCIKWYTVQSGDSCSSVENQFFITSAQFLAWNPAVPSDCSTNFWAGYAYCVGTADTVMQTRSPTSSPTPTSSAVPVPTPNQPNNAVSNCNKYAQAQSDDYCSLFAQRNSITLAQLYAWNSVLGSDGSGCNTDFWAKYYYCVGVSN